MQLVMEQFETANMTVRLRTRALCAGTTERDEDKLNYVRMSAVFAKW
jgi:hypothetical protein